MGYYIVKNGEYLTKKMKFSADKSHGIFFDTKEDAEIFIGFYNNINDSNITLKKDIPDVDYNSIDISDICNGETDDILGEIEILSKKLICCSSYLSNNLSLLDQKIGDLYHFIEFNDLNAVNGYKIYKKLQETLKERRLVKDKLFDIENLTTLINYSKVKDVKKKIQLNKNKEYKPRVLFELFK